MNESLIINFFFFPHLCWRKDSKYQSNLNEIDKFEHKSSLDSLHKGYGWPTDHIGVSLGKFFN